MSNFDLEKFRNLFFEECNMLLDRLENELLSLESNPKNKELLESVFRAMHTIKGTSGMYGFVHINEFTHILENIYQLLRDQKILFNKEISDVSLQAIDHIRHLLEDEFLAAESNKIVHAELLKKIDGLGLGSIELPTKKASLVEPKVATEQMMCSWLILLHTDEQISFRGINLMNIFEELATFGTFKIDRIEQLIVANAQTWVIQLMSSASAMDISDIFLFVDENVQIVKLSDKPLSVEMLLPDAPKTPSILELIDKQMPDIETVQVQASNTQSKTGAAKQSNKRIMVDSDKLDYLMFLVSELVTLNSNLVQDASRIKDSRLRDHIEKHDDIANLFRRSVLDIRLVPLNDSALRFQRLIRDLSGKLNKKINFKTEGIDIELDKNTIDGLTEPLMHLIRNCIDHGIESPEKRVAAGKSDSGTITLSVVQGGSNVFICIKDDGGGINKDFVRKKAIEKGIIKESDVLSESEIFDLIFLPGFSTAQSLTDVSGRGVGMDAVLQKIKDLRGEVTIESIEGVGSTFTLKIPQSLNIIDSLLFKVGASHFIVPLLDVQVCEQILLSDFQLRRDSGTIPYNDKLIAFIDLRSHLKLEGKYNSKVKTVIINNNNHYFALLVDSIIGEHHAVIRSLTKRARTLPIFNASTQLGDGQTALMIDTSLLTQFCSI